jgi:hypothetical protein
MLISRTREELVGEIATLKTQVQKMRDLQELNRRLADSLLPDEGYVNITLPTEVAVEISEWYSESPAILAVVAACKKELEEWT